MRRRYGVRRRGVRTVLVVVTAAVTATVGCGGPKPKQDQLIGVRMESGRVVVRTGMCHDERLHAIRVKVFPGTDKVEVRPREGRSATDKVDLGDPPPGWTSHGALAEGVVADKRYTVEVARDRTLSVTVPGDVLLSLPVGTWAAGGWDWDYKLMNTKEFEKRRKASCPDGP
ncbi:hypothetical protein ACFVVU_20665 [Kitasatospora sp. NPDC057965]|uniref:hypothetical protein n=1 Tax=Kitasatospora sp. NPDC057965 TaxID=3346291 RepID=UPI0036D8A982